MGSFDPSDGFSVNDTDIIRTREIYIELYTAIRFTRLVLDV